MISIAARVFDLDGHIEFTPVPSNRDGERSRRVTRTATLDGGVSVSDRGFAYGDQTLVYRYKPESKEHDDRARRIVRLHATVTVATPEGVFEAAPRSLEINNDENVFSLLVIRKLSED